MEKDASQIEIVTKENLPDILRDIGVRREEKGSSEMLLPRIHSVRAEAEKMGEKTTVLQLYQEEFLCAQHMVMEEREGLKKLKINPIRAAKGLLLMKETASKMDEYWGKNKDEIDKNTGMRVLRFLGRFEDEITRNYKKSEGYYKEGISYFESVDKVENRVNSLELRGLLSFSLLKQGRVEEGLKISEEVLDDFDNSEDGKWLKENNYSTWVVWKSGIEIRNSENILNKNVQNGKVLADKMLQDAETILRKPDNENGAFQLRLDELDRVKELSLK